MNSIENKWYSNQAGLFTLALRLVVGWTYFSAFWRRLVLDNKLIPEEAGYIGEKFNHFLPNALGIKPLIEYLVLNPEILHIAMIVFTIVEAVVGLLLMLGLFTRLMSIGVFFLAMGILLGSGWIGTTCLDEWQIGVLGVATGFVLFLTGSSSYSLDQLLINNKVGFTRKKGFLWLGSGMLNISKPLILTGSLAILGLTLFTNQYFHGGVFGTLHNKSVKPKLELTEIHYQADTRLLSFDLMRVEGADVYGSFLIGIEVLDADGQVIQKWNTEDLNSFPKAQIHNHYVAKIKPGVHSLIIPLGAKATIRLPLASSVAPSMIKLVDISGAQWESAVKE
ncbi:MAG TPA: TQO small subunit DoxD [Flavobacterium sp.]|nr:TQO small subunit DoxD [Flavobacterium sp.]